ncbi:E4 protein [Bos grunniens papillomavirus 1]|uniref:E4 protein n=1 Tax=Bos grunniens papillomavirus 1 TaxID=2758380 RepID=J7K4Y1_BPV1|nr:E4 protein [Bos grunniens papillomavirus 1]AFQ90268.1 E4 protein [Bos grunniens papillomavirus 1]AFQ90276.1 E4 protein [Bos grunniens papillomavirus 1]AFQ90284.1 E4 protein [Bos grunniens papillomavirus 1]AFQ90292.1 E4 protein [Bos grunniens papillomavirus 1]
MLVFHPPLLILEIAQTGSGSHPRDLKETHQEKKPSQPSLSLLCSAPPPAVPSEQASVGYGIILARTPTIFLQARGAVYSALPPPRCRARYRWTWHQGRKKTRNNRPTPQRKKQ